MPFLLQPSQFILALDRHQICWLAYPAVWLELHPKDIQESPSIYYSKLHNAAINFSKYRHCKMYILYKMLLYMFIKIFQ